MASHAKTLSKTPERSELSSALKRCRNAFIGIGVMSGMINILYLTGSFFMLEVYDRVLPSRSMPTLVGLVVLAAGLYMAQAVLDLIRGRILVRIGASLDESLSDRIFDTIARLPLKVGQRNDGLQPLRDLDSIRSFLSGLGPIALFDLPWLPFYIAICFAFHPLIGLTALVGAIIHDRSDGVHRVSDPRPDERCDQFRNHAQRSCRNELAQRRSIDCHGHVGPDR